MSFWLVAATGLMGAPHCIGMCGGTMSSLTMEARSSAMVTILAYNSGRVATYTLLGVVMGGAGSFVDVAGELAGLQGLASLLGGIFILLWTYRKYTIPIAEWGPHRIPGIRSQLIKLKASPSFWATFVTGILMGFIPCGLTYAMEINAVASASYLNGGLIMLVFGLSTLPALALTGALAGMMKHKLRSRITYLGQLMASVIGILAILRGLAANGWIPSVHPWLW
ncbi:sulfite exporter TauE/SafE family protein [Paenibacillus hexagrammi]|uniref:Sulfite exporter TauE/SafE family protein n=1 Tax=Paenibacillus hexagrammi TaxID=2908839 RepID=A0ABY3SM31_9BACL|nr:sulfite exporter TauE/SafE family protein [Paenibacillus sp. YPD9-1]UJF34938.1 sulfite exporter TauE/SafE family protein [Paenibacillus sp. YPD9-1]